MAVVPKIELHVHLEGTIRAHTLLDIARRNGEALPADTVADLLPLYDFQDFEHFLAMWNLTTNCLRTAADFRQVAVDYAAEAAAQGATYVEAIFSPAERFERGVPWAAMFDGYTEGAVEARERFGITMAFTPDLYRKLADLDVAAECARWCVRYADRGVVGLGIGGHETPPMAPFARAVAIARDGGLAFVPHAGEAGGVAKIVEALAYDPARIRHGIAAAADPALMRELVDRGIVLDVCPVSNVRTRVVPTLADHPLPTLAAAGVPCSISTDDPAMFDTDLERTYAAAAELGYGPDLAYAAGLTGALCDPPTRARLAALAPDRVDADLTRDWS